MNNSGPSTLDTSLAQSYARLEALKNQQNQYSQAALPSVVQAINQELAGLSEDESQFIVNSKEYQQANLNYQQDFSQFLIQKFSAEYLQQKSSRPLEELLNVIKKEKEKYKERFAADINEIRDQNKALLTKNDELANNNLILQKQLEDIQKRLMVD